MIEILVVSLIVYSFITGMTLFPICTRSDEFGEFYVEVVIRVVLWPILVPIWLVKMVVFGLVYCVIHHRMILGQVVSIFKDDLTSFGKVK